MQLDRLKDGLLRTLEKASFSRVVLPRLQPRSQSLAQPAVSAFLDDDYVLAPTLPRWGPSWLSTLPAASCVRCSQPASLLGAAQCGATRCSRQLAELRRTCNCWLSLSQFRTQTPAGAFAGQAAEHQAGCCRPCPHPGLTRREKRSSSPAWRSAGGRRACCQEPGTPAPPRCGP